METVEETRSNDRNSLRYTHKLLPGVTTIDNYGMKLSRICGGSKSISDRAEQLLNTLLPLRKTLLSGGTSNNIEYLKYRLESDLKLLQWRGKLTSDIQKQKIDKFVQLTGVQYERVLSSISVSTLQTTCKSPSTTHTSDILNIDSCTEKHTGVANTATGSIFGTARYSLSASSDDDVSRVSFDAINIKLSPVRKLNSSQELIRNVDFFKSTNRPQRDQNVEKNVQDAIMTQEASFLHDTFNNITRNNEVIDSSTENDRNVIARNYLSVMENNYVSESNNFLHNSRTNSSRNANQFIEVIKGYSNMNIIRNDQPNVDDSNTSRIIPQFTNYIKNPESIISVVDKNSENKQSTGLIPNSEFGQASACSNFNSRTDGACLVSKLDLSHSSDEDNIISDLDNTDQDIQNNIKDLSLLSINESIFNAHLKNKVGVTSTPLLVKKGTSKLVTYPESESSLYLIDSKDNEFVAKSTVSDDRNRKNKSSQILNESSAVIKAINASQRLFKNNGRAAHSDNSVSNLNTSCKVIESDSESSDLFNLKSVNKSNSDIVTQKSNHEYKSSAETNVKKRKHPEQMSEIDESNSKIFVLSNSNEASNKSDFKNKSIIEISENKLTLKKSHKLCEGRTSNPTYSDLLGLKTVNKSNSSIVSQKSSSELNSVTESNTSKLKNSDNLIVSGMTSKSNSNISSKSSSELKLQVLTTKNKLNISDKLVEGSGENSKSSDLFSLKFANKSNSSTVSQKASSDLKSPAETSENKLNNSDTLVEVSRKNSISSLVSNKSSSDLKSPAEASKNKLNNSDTLVDVGGKNSISSDIVSLIFANKSKSSIVSHNSSSELNSPEEKSNNKPNNADKQIFVKNTESKLRSKTSIVGSESCNNTDKKRKSELLNNTTICSQTSRISKINLSDSKYLSANTQKNLQDSVKSIETNTSHNLSRLQNITNNKSEQSKNDSITGNNIYKQAVLVNKSTSNTSGSFYSLNCSQNLTKNQCLFAQNNTGYNINEENSLVDKTRNSVNYSRSLFSDISFKSCINTTKQDDKSVNDKDKFDLNKTQKRNGVENEQDAIETPILYSTDSNKDSTKLRKPKKLKRGQEMDEFLDNIKKMRRGLNTASQHTSNSPLHIRPSKKQLAELECIASAYRDKSGQFVLETEKPKKLKKCKVDVDTILKK